MTNLHTIATVTQLSGPKPDAPTNCTVFEQRRERDGERYRERGRERYRERGRERGREREVKRGRRERGKIRISF